MNTIQLDSSAQPFIKQITFDFIGSVRPTVKKETINDNMVKIVLSYQLEQEVRQDDWRLQVSPAFTPDFHWSPHLTPTDRNIIDQHSFRSPALIVHDSSKYVALIPDIDILSKGTSACAPPKAYFDMGWRRVIRITFAAH